MLLVSILWYFFLILACIYFLGILVFWATRGYNKLKLKKPVALPLRAFMTGVVLYTWDDWILDNKKEFPVRYFLTETLPDFLSQVRSYFKRSFYFVKSHTYRRYHMLDLRHKFYKSGWIDMTHVVLSAPFAALVSFVENELNGVFLEEIPVGEAADSFEHWEWRVEAEQEIKALYNWWKNEFNGDDSSEEAQHMLRRLIEVRRYLWT